METADTLRESIDGLARRSADKARDLRIEARLPVAARIAALEKQLSAMLSTLPATLLAGALETLAKSGADTQRLPLDPFHGQLLSGYDGICKQLLQVPAQKLNKIGADSNNALVEARARLKRLARDGRAQLEQRLARHSATVRKAGEQRRIAVREAHAQEQLAEQHARLRARRIGIAVLIALLAALLAVAAWKYWPN